MNLFAQMFLILSLTDIVLLLLLPICQCGFVSVALWLFSINCAQILCFLFLTRPSATYKLSIKFLCTLRNMWHLV